MNRKNPLRVIFVEDSEDDYMLISLKLRANNFELFPVRVETEDDLKRSLSEGPAWDLVISDHTLPTFDAFGTLKAVKGFDPDLPVLIISGVIGEETAVAAMRAGASDYLMKSNLTRLIATIERELAESRSRRERRRIAKELEVSERRFRDLAETMPQIVWIAEADGKATYVNEQWEGFTGTRPTYGSLAEWLLPQLHADDREKTRASWDAALEKRSRFQVEYRLRNKNDSFRWQLSRAEPVLGASGQIEKWYGTCTDIEDQKQLESRLRDMNKMKDEFLATLSHELRTPLNSVIGYSELLEIQDPDSDEFRESIDAIKRNAHIQKQLISDLLDVSRIVSGKLQLNIKTLEIRPLIENAISSLRFAAEAKGVTLKLRIEDETESIRMDAARMQQVLWNLVSNAIKFTPRGGTVIIGLRRSESKVQIDVQDSGIGIAPEFLPHVFERFRQEDSSMSKHYGGLGLGLAIVRHLVELHGGTVHAESDGKDKGSLFRVCLPPLLESPDDAERRGDANPDRSGRSKSDDWGEKVLHGHRILVVDDHEDARRMVGKILRRAGAEVDIASSAEEAFRYLGSVPYSLAICDIGMPGEDGFSLIKRIRASEDLKARIPAIALTAFAAEKDEKAAEKAGFEMHLSKPVTPQHLLKSVCRLLGC